MSAAVFILLLAADFAITLLHSYQELKAAGAPLWRNFGAIVGIQIPNWLGFFGFSVVLTLALFILGFVGITGLFGVSATAFALGALMGARLSDTFVSHILLHAIGYRPNPGLCSTPFYMLEALFLAWFFNAHLLAAPFWAVVGLAAGIGFFVLVLPILWMLRFVFPACRRPAWQRWQPMPAWAASA